jgi:predicted MFS family arabinose efflux permease
MDRHGVSTGKRDAFVALASTLAIQAYVSVVASAPAVLAPILAADLGIAPSLIGVFVGLLYAGAMLSSLSGGEFVARFGAIRVSQAATLICSTGLAMMALVPASAVVLLVIAALLIGIGYGPITSASSELLARTTPPDRLALTFSIKQTGVPAGAAIAGAVSPALAIALGWRAAFLAIAVVGILVAVGAEPTRRSLDLRNPGRNVLSLRAILAPLWLIFRTPRILELSLTGCAFAAVQTCLSSFLVVYLTDALGWTVVAAGLALTCAAVAAVPGRMIWGAVADRTRAATRVLAVIGAIACVCGIALASSAPGWPTIVLLVIAAAYGATAIGWNGVQISEVARRSPPGATASITGASGFITFSGVMLGPVLFAAVVTAAGGYRPAFLACAAVSGIASIFLFRR